MFTFPPTIILRHKRENLKKCSLKGLETREDFRFFTYPKDQLPETSKYLLLAMDGTPLTKEDNQYGMILLDGTWRYAEKMQKTLPSAQFRRSIPQGFQTAYPRRQDDCQDPNKGLASIEALFIAYTILGRDTTGLLDFYYWKKQFLESNSHLLFLTFSSVLPNF
jgi:pre-rRNA-processing protein TSR3